MTYFIKFTFIFFFIFLTLFLILENYLIAKDNYLKAGGSNKFYKGFTYVTGTASLLAFIDVIRKDLQQKPEDKTVISKAEDTIKQLKEENKRLLEEQAKLQNKLVTIKQKIKNENLQQNEMLGLEEQEQDLNQKLAEVSVQSEDIITSSEKVISYTESITAHFAYIYKVRNDVNLSESDKDNLIKTKTENIRQLLEREAEKASGIEQLENIQYSAFMSFNLQDFLKSLTLLELFAFTTLCFNSIILNCLISIIFIYYGEFLIKYFNLELKYPKLAKFIAFRRSLQSYTVKFNLFLIFISVVPQLIACAFVL